MWVVFLIVVYCCVLVIVFVFFLVVEFVGLIIGEFFFLIYNGFCELSFNILNFMMIVNSEIDCLLIDGLVFLRGYE